MKRIKIPNMILDENWISWEKIYPKEHDNINEDTYKVKEIDYDQYLTDDKDIEKLNEGLKFLGSNKVAYRCLTTGTIKTKPRDK